MSDEDKLRVYVCSHNFCQNKDLYAALQAGVNNPENPLPVVLEQKNCLGACLINRVDVKFPDGTEVNYARQELKRGGVGINAIGDNPLETIITANLVQLSKRKV